MSYPGIFSNPAVPFNSYEEIPQKLKIPNSRIWRQIKGQGLLEKVRQEAMKTKGRPGSKAHLKKVCKSKAYQNLKNHESQNLIAKGLKRAARKIRNDSLAALDVRGGSLLRTQTASKKRMAERPLPNYKKVAARKAITRKKVGATGTSHGKGYIGERFNPISNGINLLTRDPLAGQHLKKGPKPTDGSANLPVIPNSHFAKPNKTVIGNFTPGIGSVGVAHAKAVNQRQNYDPSGLSGTGLIRGYGGV